MIQNVVTTNKIKIILIIGSIVTVFVITEISARIWLNYLASPIQRQVYGLFTDRKPEEYRFSPHHYLNYYPTPNYKKGLLSHNSFGYRDHEFPLQKPDGEYRIVAIGGSSTYTERVKDNTKTFTAQLEQVLKGDYGYDNVEIINAGVGGYNSWESLINLQFRVLDLNPDLVVVYQGTNDVHARLVPPALYQGDNSGRRKQWSVPPVSIWERSVFLRTISRRLGFSYQVGLGTFVNAPTSRPGVINDFDEMLGGDLIEILVKNPPVYFERNLKNMIAIAHEHGVTIMFATWAHSSRFEDYASTEHYEQGFQENNAVVVSVAESHNNVPLFDFAAVMPQDESYWADGRHVNEKGAIKKAELFAEFIHKINLIPN